VPGSSAVIGVNVQPLIAWLWTGGAVMALGTLLAAWPRDRRRRPGPDDAVPPVAADEALVARPDGPDGPDGPDVADGPDLPDVPGARPEPAEVPG
jgi:cytochrome c-type biogenesis protein CcmF